MPPLANSPIPLTTQKRAYKEATTSSILSDHDSREFDDVTAAREDPNHQIGEPPLKQRRAREDKALWLFALNKALVGLLARGKLK